VIAPAIVSATRQTTGEGKARGIWSSGDVSGCFGELENDEGPIRAYGEGMGGFQDRDGVFSLQAHEP
jgi:hypothetical protein